MHHDSDDMNASPDDDALLQRIVHQNNHIRLSSGPFPTIHDLVQGYRQMKAAMSTVERDMGTDVYSATQVMHDCHSLILVWSHFMRIMEGGIDVPETPGVAPALNDPVDALFEIEDAAWKTRSAYGKPPWSEEKIQLWEMRHGHDMRIYCDMTNCNIVQIAVNRRLTTLLGSEGAEARARLQTVIDDAVATLTTPDTMGLRTELRTAWQEYFDLVLHAVSLKDISSGTA